MPIHAIRLARALPWQPQRLALVLLCFASPATPAQDVRLSTGTSGRVEVFYNGQWGTICNMGFGTEEASVVCRQLGLGPGKVGPAEPGTGLIWLDEVSCTGSEARLRDCRHGEYGTYRCNSNHSDDVGVQCTVVGDARLSAGDRGRVEVFDGSHWGTVCGANYFDEVNAWVVCRQLGFVGGTVLPSSQTTPGSHTVLTSVTCAGTEARLGDCSHRGLREQTCDRNAGAVEVQCAQPREGQLQLSEGYSGLLQIFRGGLWRTVCSDAFGLAEARLVCAELGFGGGAIVNMPASENPSQSQNQKYERLGEVACNTAEPRLRLASCGTVWGGQVCKQDKADAGLVMSCEADFPGKVRLEHGSSGRVEVFYKGLWGTVCDDFFDNQEAQVICRMLGYSHGSSVLSSDTNDGSGPIWLDSLQCTGGERQLIHCDRDEFGSHDCGHNEDAGVCCGSHCSHGVRVQVPAAAGGLWTLILALVVVALAMLRPL